MIYEIPLSDEPIQEQLFSLFGMNLRLTLYYNPISHGWQFDLSDTDTNRLITQRQGLAINAPSLIEKNLPFILMLADKSHFGINALYRRELGVRIQLYLIDKGLWHEAIRETA